MIDTCIQEGMSEVFRRIPTWENVAQRDGAWGKIAEWNILVTSGIPKKYKISSIGHSVRSGFTIW